MRRGVLQQQSVPELTSLVSDEPFSTLRTVGKFSASLGWGGWAWNLWSLELLTPGAARKWEWGWGRRPSWVGASSWRGGPHILHSWSSWGWQEAAEALS